MSGARAMTSLELRRHIKNSLNTSPRGTSTSNSNSNSPIKSMKKITKVRRDLFGPIDHEESARFIEAELARKQTHDSERWGFDFSLGVPLDNNENFEWEPVYTFMPQYYSLQQQQTRNRLMPEQTEQNLQYFQNPEDLSIMDIDTKLYEDLQPNPMSSGSSMESWERTPLQNHNTNQAPKKFRQLFITDLMKNRKRTCNKSTNLSPVKLSSPSTTSSTTSSISSSGSSLPTTTGTQPKKLKYSSDTLM